MACQFSFLSLKGKAKGIGWKNGKSLAVLYEIWYDILANRQEVLRFEVLCSSKLKNGALVYVRSLLFSYEGI